MNYNYFLKGLSCPDCAKKIENSLKKEKGFENVALQFTTSMLSFTSDREDVFSFVSDYVKKIEPNVTVYDLKKKVEQKNYHFVFSLLRLLFGTGMVLLALWNKTSDALRIILLVLGYSLLLIRVFKVSIRTILKEHVIDENFLILISALGACILHKEIEGMMVIILYEIGKILESKAVMHTRNSITNLVDMKIDYAYLYEKDKLKPIALEELKVKDLICVRKGEKVPVDGILKSDHALFDTSMITGESLARKLKYGEEVISGYINLDGPIKVEVTTLYKDSTAKRILDLILNAPNRKAKTETMVNKFAKIYTPVILIIAFLVFIFFPLFAPITYQESFYRALTFLILSCPCSIAISVPLSYFSGLGRSSKSGILIKGSDYLDKLNNIDAIIFDKTGTITNGNFSIKEVKVFNSNDKKEEIFDYLYKGEMFSSHPISQAILKTTSQEIDVSKVQNFQEVTGNGISYTIENAKIKIGSQSFVANHLKNKKDQDLCDIYISKNDQIIGGVLFETGIKDGVLETIKYLNGKNIAVKMFTGDRKDVALKIADKLNIQDVRYELLPDEKEKELEKVQQEYQNVCFVGDGINDAPVLAYADLGISMGAKGSEIAIEASDIVLMKDDITKIKEGMEISKKTKQIIIENLLFALGTKLIVLILNLFGISGMWEAIFADVGTTLLTILNTLRILKIK